MFKIFFTLLLTTSAYCATYVLPDLSSISCESSRTKQVSFWFDLMANRIDGLIQASNVQGTDKDILKNQLVSLSYLELFKTSQNDSTTLMSYVYSNASHHLGRLVRYHFWENYPTEELGEIDRSLISGELLGAAVRNFPKFLSQRLMSHSLDLYKVLSWSLVARSHCGPGYVNDLLKDTGNHHFPGLMPFRYNQLIRLLKSAHQEATPAAFMKKFVAYEQTYLQYTMYSLPDIRVPTAIGVLDKMRFIPFNGEKQKSFYEWCNEKNCGSTSLDLKNRVYFDRDAITPEIALMSESRIRNSGILEVTHFILNSYCKENKLPINLCL